MLLRRKPTYRDANGRFRRQTRDDMNVFERMNYDMLMRLIPKMVEDITRPLAMFDSARISNTKVGTSLRIRLPSDYA